jgi:CubicO group peptidase (beta-lactamase class C family)
MHFKLSMPYAQAAAICSVLILLGATTAPNAAGLAGTWAMDQTFGAQLTGVVSVRGFQAPVAELAGLSTLGERTADGWLFRFSGDRGELRTASFSNEHVSAMWVQPALPAGSRYATPVALAENAPGTWRGTIAPLENRLFMTLHIVRAADGVTQAFLRDPLYNLGRRYGMMNIAVNGRTIRFISAKAGTLVADLDPSGASFALHVGDLGLPPFQFSRAPAANSAAVAYEEPLVTGDGWLTAPASSVGIATATLVALTHDIASSQPVDALAPDVHSVTIARHGKLVFDRYFSGFDESTPHDTRSAGKTYADVLAGAAILAQVPLDDTTPLLTLFPQYPAVANNDARKRAITFGNALSMSTGLDCDDNDDKSIGNEDAMQSQTRQNDWYKLVLDTKMVREPGTRAVYCSASINLAGGAIATATRSWLPIYFEEHIAQPLAMERYALNLTPEGQWYLGGGAYVRPRDMLKIGQVYLDHGQWHGEQIVARDWVEKSWRKRLAMGPGDDYSYAWHIRSYTAGTAVHAVFEAQGNGGQILDVVPDLDLVVMMTQGNYNSYGTWGKTRDRIMNEILRAVTP